MHLTFAFRRHEEPGKTPEGMSADWLTEAGKAHAKETGKGLEAEYLMVAGSKGVKRARETGGLILGSFRDEHGASAIVNREMSADQQKDLGHGEMPPGDRVIYRSGDLDPVKNFAAVVKAAKAEGAMDLGSQIQWWLDHPAECQAMSVPTSKEIAAEMAHRLSIGLKMSGKLYAGLDVRFENLTHGPKLEALLKEILVHEGQAGFKRLEEIGGMVQPGENIDFDIRRDETGQESIKLKLRGHEYDIDMAALARLQELYARRQEANRSAKGKK